jgi:hypothetical protein
MVRTGDLLTGREVCSVAQYMDTLYDLWGSDTVHGDKIAYSKIAIGLLDRLNRNLPETGLGHNLHSRKRSLDASLDLHLRREADNPPDSMSARAAQAAATVGAATAPTGSNTDMTSTSPTERDEPQSSYRSNRDSTAFSAYPGDLCTGRDQTPRRFGGCGASRCLDY